MYLLSSCQAREAVCHIADEIHTQPQVLWCKAEQRPPSLENPVSYRPAGEQ